MLTATATDMAAMHLDIAPMRAWFNSGATRSYNFRKKQLQQLQQTIRLYETRIMDALHADLHKSPEEAFGTEIGLVQAEITHALQHLHHWMKPVKVNSPFLLFPSSSKILRDPLGITLIIAPWNYPFQLLFAPLVGAIAGGNCALLKPSELAPHTAAVTEAIIRETFDKSYIDVIQGDGAMLVRQLLKDHRFDHIFFTGSHAVGRSIATLAAEKLTPVTLELGGKSPCIVDDTVNLQMAASRIVWGKFTNAGQTCIAPDYLLVQENSRDALVNYMQQSIRDFYGEDPSQSPDYGRIINRNRYNKLLSYLSQGNILTGGQVNATDLYIAPTLMDEVRLTQPLMQEEIFGPVLPVFTYRSREEAAAFIERYHHPLSLYLFSNSKTTQQYFTENIAFGGGCINNTLVHFANPSLPFGGVGSSGTGQYHGRYSFETFTRPKAMLQTATWINPSLRFPPYTGKLKWLKWFLR